MKKYLQFLIKKVLSSLFLKKIKIETKYNIVINVLWYEDMEVYPHFYQKKVLGITLNYCCYRMKISNRVINHGMVSHYIYIKD